MRKHKVLLSDEEIEILLNALDSADFYPPEDEAEKFFMQINKLRKRLGRLLDVSFVLKQHRAGVIGYLHKQDKEREKYFKEFLAHLRRKNSLQTLH